MSSSLDSSLNVPLFPRSTISGPSVEIHLTSDKHRPVLLPASQRALKKPSMPFFSVCQIPEEAWSLLICVCAESMEWTSCASLCLHWNNIRLINTTHKCSHSGVRIFLQSGTCSVLLFLEITTCSPGITDTAPVYIFIFFPPLHDT